jgi:hypothetical protein
MMLQCGFLSWAESFEALHFLDMTLLAGSQLSMSACRARLFTPCPRPRPHQAKEKTVEGMVGLI